MTFWERYEKLCLDSGYKPGSEQAAQVLGSNRGTISAWKKNGNLPTSELLVRIADAYGVSTDYLLGRAENPIDFAHSDTCEESTWAQLFSQLDEADRCKAEGYMHGLLSQDKYTSNPKHV